MSKMNYFTVLLVLTFISMMVYDLQVSILTYFGIIEKSMTAMEVRMSTLPKAKLKIPESKYEDDPFPGVSVFIAITLSALATFLKVKSSTRISNYRLDVFPHKKEPSLNKSGRNDLFEERLEALDEKLKSTEEITRKWSERIRQTEKELDFLRKQIINVKNDGFLEQQNKEVYDRENLFKKIVDEVIKESRNELKEEAMFDKLYKKEYYRKNIFFDKNSIKGADIELDVNCIRGKTKTRFLRGK